MMHLRSAILAVSALGVLALPTASAAGANDWWPFSVVPDGPDKTPIQYVPLPKAEKKWNLCVLFPHLKDSYWVAVNYGIVQEAERLGVRAYTYQAGGYDQLPKQLSLVERPSSSRSCSTFDWSGARVAPDRSSHRHDTAGTLLEPTPRHATTGERRCSPNLRR